MKILSKKKIIKLFKKNVKGKIFKVNSKKHDGSEGHWLERCFGVIANFSNSPDIGGFELKKKAKVISFGDWSATEYLFSKSNKLLNEINKDNFNMTRIQFIKLFGCKNENKPNRYSWSGKCVPKYGKWNKFGQKLKIDKNNNILVMYSYKRDKRKKNNKLYKKLKKKKICIAIWSAQKMEKLVNSKFNNKGYIICKKNKKGDYDKICFGKCIYYDLFIDKIKSRNIYFDSGMYYDSVKDNKRFYSQWRAISSFWDGMIIEEY